MLVDLPRPAPVPWYRPKKFEPLLLVTIGFRRPAQSNIPGVRNRNRGWLVAPRLHGRHRDRCVFPLIIFMGVGAMTDFGPLLANPRAHCSWVPLRSLASFATLLGASGADQFRLVMDFLAEGGGRDRHHWRRRWPDRDLCGGAAGPAPSGRHCSRRLFLHGAGADHSATDHARR